MTSPSPLSPSTVATLLRSRTTVILGLGLILPILNISTYDLSLATPCESMPRTSALESTSAACRASSSGTPRCLNTDAVKSFRYEPGKVTYSLSTWRRLSLPGNLALFAQSVDTQFNYIAFLQEPLWIHAHADAGGRSCRNDVAGEQRHKATKVAYEKGNLVDQVRGRSILTNFAVEFQPQAKVIYVCDFIPRSEKRTQRCKRITAFPLHPLAAVLELKFAFTVVVVQAVAGHIIHRICFFHVTCALANHNGELQLPIGFLAVARNHKIVVGPNYGRGRLKEDDRLGRNCGT